MNMRRSVLVFTLVTAIVIVLGPVLAAQNQPNYQVMEVEKINVRNTDDPVLKKRFNYDKPFVIQVNRKIPNARALRDNLVQFLGKKGLLDILAFNWFGETELQSIEINIGVNVPLGISQSVLRTFSKQAELPLIVSVESQDDRVGGTQHIYIGSLVKSGKKPIDPSKLNALMSDEMSRDDFVRTIGTLE